LEEENTRLSESTGTEGLHWIVCDDAFVAADVIRFRESVWERKGPRGRTRSVRVGEREVIAEVLHDDPDREGWVFLRVVRCEVLKAFTRKGMHLKQGSDVRRKRKTVLRNGVDRLPWSDEGARAAVVADWKARHEWDFGRQ
jgi:hypothetical protein